MFTLAQDYKERGMAATPTCSRANSPASARATRRWKHQEFVGVGYFDEITQIVHGGHSSTVALEARRRKSSSPSGIDFAG